MLSWFRDPKVRNAYLLTKVAVLAAAALATVPLARVFGVKAWYGLGAFALVLGVLTALLLVAAALAGEAREEEPPEAADVEADPASADAVVELPIEDSLDLHSFPPAVVPQVVEDYLAEAHACGFTEVRLIHGRGIGVQRERVRSLLSRHPLVESFADAPPARGGWGATVAVLRQKG
jgi:hypothetical protein